MRDRMKKLVGDIKKTDFSTRAAEAEKALLTDIDTKLKSIGA